MQAFSYVSSHILNCTHENVNSYEVQMCKICS